MCSRAARHGGRRCQAGSFPGRKRGHWWVGTLDLGLDGRCGRWWAPGSPVKMGSPWTATSNGSPAIAPTTLSNPARAGARPPKAAVTGSGRAHGARSASRRPSQRSVRRRLSARDVGAAAPIALAPRAHRTCRGAGPHHLVSVAGPPEGLDAEVSGSATSTPEAVPRSTPDPCARSLMPLEHARRCKSHHSWGSRVPVPGNFR
jgi:hypothetical protein